MKAHRSKRACVCARPGQFGVVLERAHGHAGGCTISNCRSSPCLAAVLSDIEPVHRPFSQACIGGQIAWRGLLRNHAEHGGHTRGPLHPTKVVRLV